MRLSVIRMLIAASLWASAALATVQPACAAPIPWREARVSIVAREQPVRDFLRDLFAGQGLAVHVSESVSGTVNGTFRGAADRVFSDVERAYALVHYFDGSMVYVYASAETQSGTVSVAPGLIPAVVRSLDATNMYDSHNTFRALTNEGLVLLNGTRRFVEQVQQVAIAVQSQASAAPSAFRVFRLRYAWATDVTLSYGNRQMTVPGVATTLRKLLGVPARDGGSLEPLERNFRPTANRLGGTGLAAAGDARTPAPPLPGQTPSPPAQAGTARQDGPPTMPPDEFYATPDRRASADGSTAHIEADARLNAVIVRDAKERMPYYEELIPALDVEQQLIEIQATIIDVNSDRARDLGINWRFNNKHADVLYGKGDSTDLGLQRNSAQITPSQAGLAISTVIGDASAFISRISALEDENAARIVSRPQVLTLGNVEAILENNQTFYVKVPGAYQVDLFNVVAGTTLKVTPHVVYEGGQTLIRLLVNVEDGGFTNNPDSNVEQLPVVSRSSINTQAVITSGESLLIGGMVRESKSKSVSKVPVLGDVPIIGNLFKNTHDAVSKTERMFLISPRIVSARGGEVPSQPPSTPMPPPFLVDPARGAQPAPQPGTLQQQARIRSEAAVLPLGRDATATAPVMGSTSPSAAGRPAAPPANVPGTAPAAQAALAPARPAPAAGVPSPTAAPGAARSAPLPAATADRTAPKNPAHPLPPADVPVDRARRNLIPASNPMPARSVFDIEG
jgi:type III secretion protein C